MSQPADGAGFIARMAAGTTHEFRNVLAIVGESAGLIQDLVQARGAPNAEARGSVLRALQRIERQVARGAELVSALNGLAHALDQDCETLDLADQARAAAVLCRHWTNQLDRCVSVAPSVGVRVCASRLRLCQLLTAAIESMAVAVPAGGQVVLAALLHDDSPALQVRGRAPETAAAPEGVAAPAEPAPDWSRLVNAAAAVGGSVERFEGNREFLVLFPARAEGV